MTTPLDRLAGALGDRYRIEREVGAGGMATVYLAEDLKHHRKVAVKVLRPDLAAALGPERFLREVTIAANLQHPHILPLHDSGEAAGFLYYVMPYVEGATLREKLVREGELPIAEAVRILRDVADAMAYAHQRGVVHRDIKPENVMLSGRHALVTDFGVAKAVSEATGRQTLTTAGVALGTPTYMAPEQAAADPHTDHRADIYAFGVVAYELLTGRPPFTGATPQAVMAAQVTMPADPVTRHRASIPPALAALVMKCLEKKPADRWQSADELIPVLEATLTPSGGMAPVAAARSLVPRIVAAVAVVVIGILGWQLVRRPSAAAVRTEARSIAVLPLVNAGANADDEYLADGIADGLTSALSKVPGLKVASRNSAFLLRGTALSAKQKADTLGVATILEGSMQRGLGRIRVTLQLLSAKDGLAQWTESYDRPAADLMAVQDEIVQQVAAALQLHLGGLPLAVSKAGRSANPEANDLYLRGQFWLNKSSSEEGLRKALEYFQAAVVKDPGFAAAHAGIGVAWGEIADAYEPGPTAHPKANAAAAAALARDTLLAEAHGIFGFSLWATTWSAREAEHHMRRALELDGNSTAASWTLAFFLCNAAVGRIDEGLRTLDRTIATNPLDARLSYYREGCLFNARQYDSVITQGRRTLELDPNFFYADSFSGWALVLQGRLAEATAEYERVRRTVPNAPVYGPVMILAKTGHLAEARAELRKLEQRADVIPVMIAALLGWVGEPTPSFALLEQLLVRRDHLLPYFLESELFDPIRTDPRYDDLVRRVHEVAGLPPPKR